MGDPTFAQKKASDFSNRQIDALVEKNMGAVQQDMSLFLQNKAVPRDDGRMIMWINIPNITAPNSKEQTDLIKKQFDRTSAAVNEFMSMWRQSPEGKNKALNIAVRTKWLETEGQYSLELERTAPVSIAGVRLSKVSPDARATAVAAGQEMVFAVSGSKFVTMVRKLTPNGQLAEGEGTVDFGGEVPYAAQFSVRADTKEVARVAFISAMQQLLSFYGFSDIPSDWDGLVKFCTANGTEDERKRTELLLSVLAKTQFIISGSATMEIIPVMKGERMENKDRYSRQEKDNATVAQERRDYGTVVTDEFFGLVFGGTDSRPPPVRTADAYTVKILEENPNGFMHYLMSCGLVGGKNDAAFVAYMAKIGYDETKMGAIAEGDTPETQDTTGTLLFRKFLYERLIVEKDGAYALSDDPKKRAALNGYILQVALGGLRDENNQNDPLTQAFSHYREITFGVKGKQAVAILLGAPAQVDAGGEMSVPVKITRILPDGSPNVIEHPQESIDFKDVKVLGPNGRPVNYSYDEATNSIKFTATAAGKYPVSAVGMILDTKHNLLMDTDSYPVEGVAKEVPTPKKAEIPRTPLDVKPIYAPATAATTELRVPVMTMTESSNLNSVIPAASVDELRSILDAAAQTHDLGERNSILSTQLRDWARTYGGVASTFDPNQTVSQVITSFLTGGKNFDDLMAAWESGGVDIGFGMIDPNSPLGRSLRMRMEQVFISDVDMLRQADWTAEGNVTLSYGKNLPKSPVIQNVTAEVFAGKKTVKPRFSRSLVDYQRASTHLAVITADKLGAVQLGVGADLIRAQGKQGRGSLSLTGDVARSFTLGSFGFLPYLFGSQEIVSGTSFDTIKRGVAGGGLGVKAPIIGNIDIKLNPSIYMALRHNPKLAGDLSGPNWASSTMLSAEWRPYRWLEVEGGVGMSFIKESTPDTASKNYMLNVKVTP
jgi:hypothetical protein